VPVVIFEERRRDAEAAGPPSPAMLDVLRACREMHRADGALAEEARRNADGAPPAKPGDARAAEGEPRGPASDDTRNGRPRAELRQAQERLRAALRRAGASEREPPDEGTPRR
jgi:hypothetical protein